MGFAAVIVILLLVAFQNCSPQGFEVISGVQVPQSLVDTSAPPVQPTPEESTPYDEGSLEKIPHNSSILKLKPKQIFQRQGSANTAPVSIEVVPYNSTVQWLTVLVSKNATTVFKKTFAAADLVKVAGNFQMTFSVRAGGWYQLQVLQVVGNTAYVSTHSEFGVGDIYVIAGQSNAANHAETKTQSKNPLVVMYDPETGNWASCQDPLPFASVFSHLIGAGVKGQGSTWPELGDLLAQEDQVPIGFLSTAMGGSPLKSWLPGGPAFYSEFNIKNQPMNYNLYQRLLTSTQRLLAESKGFKMVLWHQGESDLENCNVANPGVCDSVLYTQKLMQLKTSLDKDLKINTRWMVAQTSFFPANAESYMAGQPCVSIKNYYAGSGALLAVSQRNLWGLNNIVKGPSSDDLLDAYRFNGQFGGCVHFSYKGQAEMSKRWYAAILQARSAVPSAQFKDFTSVTGTVTCPLGSLCMSAVGGQVIQSQNADGSPATKLKCSGPWSLDYTEGHFTNYCNGRVTTAGTLNAPGYFSTVQ